MTRATFFFRSPLPLLAVTLAALAVFLVGDAQPTAYAQAVISPGDLDTSFGTDGKVTTDFGASDRANAVAVQADGKIVVGGESNFNFALARYNTDGSLDTSFSTDGKVTTDFGSSERGYAVAVQSDGKIVVAGEGANASDQDFGLARYNTDGSLDTSFDTDGKLITNIGSSDDLAFAMAVQSDGKIVAAGRSSNGSNYDFALARYNANNGSLDTSFSTDGKVTTAIGSGNDYGYAMAVQSDGKIVVAGISNNGNNDDFALARYNTDGSLDTSFGSNGKVTTAIGSGDDDALAVAVQSDGKIVVAGSSDGHFALARYNADGTLDTSFSTDGKVTTSFGTSNEGAQAVAVQSDGKIVAAGRTSTHIALVRYNADGSLDTSFSSDGKVTTAIGGTGDRAYAVALQSNGKIVVAGQGNNDFALARYHHAVPTTIVSPASVTVREGGPKKTVTVTLSEVVTQQARVGLLYTGDIWEDVQVVPAQSGVSYPTIPRNQKTFQIVLTPVDDRLREGTETYTLPIGIDTDRDGSFDDITGSIELVVEDNEQAPDFRLEASRTTIAEGDSLRVQVIDAPDDFVAVEASGTAKLGVHVTVSPNADFFMDRPHTFKECPSDPQASCDDPPETTWGLPDDEGWITVGTVPDGVSEGDETIIFTAFNANNPDQRTEPLTITVRDLAPANLILTPSSTVLRKNGAPVTVSLTLDRPSQETTRIRIDPSGTASVWPLGENRAGYDYEMVPSQKTVSASETQVEAFIRIEKGETQGKSKLTLTALNDATPGQTITLTARSGAYPRRFGSGSTTITIGEPLPRKPDLIGLTASSIDPRGSFTTLPLTPSTFRHFITDYTATVASSVAYVKLTPTVEERYKWSATVQVGPQGGNLRQVNSGSASHSIPLVEGANPITVRVTLADGSNSKDYTVTVTREASVNAQQGGLSGSQGVGGVSGQGQSPQQEQQESQPQLGGSSGDEGVVPQGQSPQQQEQQGGGSGSQGDEGVVTQGQSPPQSGDSGQQEQQSQQQDQPPAQQQQTPTNRAPTVSTAIADVSGLEEGGTREISLSGVFSDADGDALTITASSDYETVATVSVASDGSALSVAGVSAGTATITVTARDPNGNSATDDFGVTVTDPAPQGQEQQQPPAQQPQQVTATTTTTTEPEEQETEVEETETEAESPDAASRYDADGDGFISQPELRQALDDYYAAKITYSEMLQVYKAYRSSR